MVPSIILRPGSLLAVLSLIGALQPPQVQATRGTCQELNFKPGDVISTTAERRTYCGNPVGRYLALKNNVLFHLSCYAKVPTEAKVNILDLNDNATRSQTFASNQVCDVEPSQFNKIVTGENAYNIAQKLSSVLVPYDVQTCNAQHYIEYLGHGKNFNRGLFTAKPDCPVFKPFDSGTNINAPNFRLAGQNGMNYNWPAPNGKLTLLSSSTSPASAPSYQPYPSFRSTSSNVSTSGQTAGGKSVRTTERRGSHGGGGFGPGNGGGGGSGNNQAATNGFIWGSSGGSGDGHKHHKSSAGRNLPFGGIFSASRRD